MKQSASTLFTSKRLFEHTECILLRQFRAPVSASFDIYLNTSDYLRLSTQRLRINAEQREDSLDVTGARATSRAFVNVERCAPIACPFKYELHFVAFEFAKLLFLAPAMFSRRSPFRTRASSPFLLLSLAGFISLLGASLSIRKFGLIFVEKVSRVSILISWC